MNEDPMRGAIVLSKDLEPGVAVNAAAITFAYLVHVGAAMFGSELLSDFDGVVHATIKHNVAVLKANSSLQITNHIQTVLPHIIGIRWAVFSNRGRLLSNSYAEYRELVGRSPTIELEPIALAIVGGDQAVKAASKKFSFFKVAPRCEPQLNGPTT